MAAHRGTLWVVGRHLGVVVAHWELGVVEGHWKTFGGCCGTLGVVLGHWETYLGIVVAH